jgi:hypothetical protein
LSARCCGSVGQRARIGTNSDQLAFGCLSEP